jgi:3-phenylpropionate/cinnamic acid dioxygenase small subunit
MDSRERDAITDLLLEYCFFVDNKRWDDFDRVFTSDIRFVNDHVQLEVRGLNEVKEWYRNGRHPAAHMVTNVMVDHLDGDQARTRSKYVTVQHAGTAGTGEYHDELRRTADGWRISTRSVLVRAAPPYPAR